MSALHQPAGHLAIRIADAFRPRLSLGVRLVALDDAGGVFLVRHSYLPGLHLPGGAVDAGETCREAAVREAREEGGLVLRRAARALPHLPQPAGAAATTSCSSSPAAPASRGRRGRGSRSSPRGFHPLDALPPDLTARHPPPHRRGARRRPPDDVW